MIRRLRRLESDDKGRLYGGDLEHNSIWRRNPDGTYRTLAQGADLTWIDTLSVASDRHLYATANQLNRCHPSTRARTCAASPISWSDCRSTPGRSGSCDLSGPCHAGCLAAGPVRIPAGRRSTPPQALTWPGGA